MKICSRCHQQKEERDFQIRRASRDGLTAACRACLAEYDKERAGLPHRVSAIGFDPKRDMPFKGTRHNALDDAIHQAKYVSAIWKKLAK